MVWVSSQVSHFVSATGVIFSVSYPDSPYYVSLPLISSQPLRTQEAGPAQIGARFVTHGTIPFHHILKSSSKEQSFQSMRHPFSKAAKGPGLLRLQCRHSGSPDTGNCPSRPPAVFLQRGQGHCSTLRPSVRSNRY